MNGVFLFALILYFILFLAIGFFDLKKNTGFSDYITAGKRQSTAAVTMTLLATMLGASATIGICDTVNSIGFPGIWWLVFGAVGLVLQSVLLSERVRGMNADTLPDLARITVGPAAELLLSFIIVISWIGVIAGQIVAMNGLVTFATGKDSKLLFAAVSAAVILYTLIGGQMSVVKTDRVQLVIIVVGLVAACIFLYAVRGGGAELASNVELLNKDYKPINLFTQFFVIGGAYFLGPDIMSRNFLSKDERTAKKSALLAGLILLALSVVITLIGMWVRMNVGAEELAGNKTLMYVVGILPHWLAVLLTFGLLSAVVSSTDTCIINASAILVKDILKKESTAAMRIAVGVIGAVSVALALSGRGDILSLLSGAYSIYTPGVIFPLTIAILAHRSDAGKLCLNKTIWLIAVACGGLFGLCGTYLTGPLTAIGIPQTVLSNFPLIGMGVSLVISLCSLRRKA